MLAGESNIANSQKSGTIFAETTDDNTGEGERNIICLLIVSTHCAHNNRQQSENRRKIWLSAGCGGNIMLQRRFRLHLISDRCCVVHIANDGCGTVVSLFTTTAIKVEKSKFHHHIALRARPYKRPCHKTFVIVSLFCFMAFEFCRCCACCPNDCLRNRYRIASHHIASFA